MANLTGWPWLRHQLAANLLDAPRYALSLRYPRLGQALGCSWVGLRNRGEVTRRPPEQRGVDCAWRGHTRALYYCQAYPAVGQRLLARALAEWPIEFSAAPRWNTAAQPQVSFLIGHRGLARLPHLRATLRSIAAQQQVAVECLVIEQAVAPEVASSLPSWVRHVWTPPPRADMPFSRSWAFNCGARAATGAILVCLDNDLLVPMHFARELVETFARGFVAARLHRFISYLDAGHTERIFATGMVQADSPPLEIVQNCEGGALAIGRATYFDVGGHDEEYLGWGGEDNELFNRLDNPRTHVSGYLHLAHLYHLAAPGKGTQHGNVGYHEARMRLPAEMRVADLKTRAMGEPAGPSCTSMAALRKMSVA